MTICFPIGSTAVTWLPTTRWMAGPGVRALAPRTSRPTRSGRKAAAVWKIVSPSGTPHVPLRSTRQARRLRMAQGGQAQSEPEVFAFEANLLEQGPNRRIQDRFAVNPLDGQLASWRVLGQAP